MFSGTLFSGVKQAEDARKFTKIPGKSGICPEMLREEIFMSQNPLPPTDRGLCKIFFFAIFTAQVRLKDCSTPEVSNLSARKRSKTYC